MSTDTRVSVAVQSAPFDLAHEFEQFRLRCDGAGAVVSFVGMVRDMNLSEGVQALELEHYPGMTQKSLCQIALDAVLRWQLQSVRLIHRVGLLLPGDPIVLVLTASAHRQAAYEASEYIMDYLKSEAPFWKKEWTAQGARWLSQRQSDQSALLRWRDAA